MYYVAPVGEACVIEQFCCSGLLALIIRYLCRRDLRSSADLVLRQTKADCRRQGIADLIPPTRVPK